MFVPATFLFRVAYPCREVKKVPLTKENRLLDLPEECRLEPIAALEGKRAFADVRIAWNELGMGVQVEVRGKEQLPQGDAERVRGSDGLTFWVDTRDSRTS